MLSIAHIVNPVVVSGTSDLFKAQPITFATMKQAQEFAGDKIKVTLLSEHYPEDLSDKAELRLPRPELRKLSRLERPLAKVRSIRKARQTNPRYFD